MKKKLGIALAAAATLIVAVVWLIRSLGMDFHFAGWR